MSGSVWCPNCGESGDIDQYDLDTYSGDNNNIVTCIFCKKEFYVAISISTYIKADINLALKGDLL